MWFSCLRLLVASHSPRTSVFLENWYTSPKLYFFLKDTMSVTGTLNLVMNRIHP